MQINYHIYSNHGNGGPVDLSTPLVTTAELSCVFGPLGVATDNTFLVRAFDTATGLEEANTAATVRVVIGPDGVEKSGLPNAPHAVCLSSITGGGGLIGWAYAPAKGWGIPDGFHVYLTPGMTLDQVVPAATIPYVPGRLGYSCVIPGPLPPTTYLAAVRSFNAVGTEGNTMAISAVIGRSTVPYVMDPVQSAVVGT